ncbi:MAG: zf-HC2 domain-containing protein [Planctomycetota bacterium]|jgi:hypothetical protein
MADAQERSARQSYARAQLVCREVREDLVALQRDELSPIRAESVRQHLASCPECREVALDVELAIRSWSALPELEPPVGLAERAARRAVEGEGAGRRPSEGSAAAAEKRPAAERPAAERPAAERPAAERPEPADSPEAEIKATKVLDVVAPPSADGDAEHKTSVFFRPVRHPLARVGAAAALLVTVLTLANWTVADALKRAQRRVLGPGFVETVSRVTDAVLTKLRL